LEEQIMADFNTFNLGRRKVLKVGAALGAASALAPLSTFAKGDDPVRIGQIESLTGTYAALGNSQVNGAKLAIEQINAKGGILGRPVELVVEDDAANPGLGSQKAHRLVERDKVNFLMGAVSSAVALSVSQTANRLNTIYVVTGAHTDAVTGSKCNWNTFRTCTTTWMLAAGNSKTLFDKFGKKWYFVTPDYAFGHTLQHAYAEQLKSYGGETLGNALAPLGTTDFSSYLIKAAAAKPDVLIVLQVGDDKINVLKQATQFGLDKKMGIGGGELNLEEIEGLPTDARIGWWTMEWYWDQPNTPHVKEFVETYRKKNEGKTPSARSWFGFATAHALALAANKAKSLDSVKVAKAMEGLELSPEIALQPGQLIYRAGDHQMIGNEFPGEIRHDGKYPDLFKLASITPGSKIARSVEADGCKLVYPS
jgi:branched-chain amino acid transport system substrate-binding protein